MNYVVLPESGISTVPNFVITGNIDVSLITNSAMTGFSETSKEDGTAATINQVTAGFLYCADYEDPTTGALTTVVSDMETAYNHAASRPNSDAAKINLKNGIIAGDTMTPGVVYTFSVTVDISAGIVFCGDHDDVFIIQMTLTIDVAPPQIRRCSWIVAQTQIISSGRSQKLSLYAQMHTWGQYFGLYWLYLQYWVLPK